MRVAARSNISLPSNIDYTTTDGLKTIYNGFVNLFKNYNLESIFSVTLDEENRKVVIKNVNVDYYLTLTLEKDVSNGSQIILTPIYTSVTFSDNRNVSNQSVSLSQTYNYISVHIICIDNDLQYISMRLYTTIDYSFVSSLYGINNCISYGFIKGDDNNVYEVTKYLSIANDVNNIGNYSISTYENSYMGFNSSNASDIDIGLYSLLPLQIYSLSTYNPTSLIIKTNVKNTYFVQGNKLILNGMYANGEDKYIAIYQNVLYKLT